MRKIASGAALAALLALSACGGGEPVKIEGLTYVKAGKFKMGYGGEKARPNEKPEREAECDHGFYIGVYEVTNEEYSRFLAATKRAAPSHWKDGKYPDGQGRYPVTRVSWADALAYCEWLSKEKGGGYRLPNEIEWEYAARGEDGRLYPFGNEFVPGKVNSAAAGKDGPVEVGQFKDGRGPFGTFDQAGNVWEWTSSDGPATGQKMIKGGSYAPLEDLPRASLRTPIGKEQAKDTIGFRVAKDE
jgi:serine/threonine-protein kinase